MNTSSAASVEKEVLAVLEEAPELPNTLIDRLKKDKGLNDEVIRNTLWKLIDGGKIQLNRERKLELASTASTV